MGKKVYDIQGIIDSDTGEITGLIVAGQNNRQVSNLPNARELAALRKSATDANVVKELGSPSARGQVTQSSLELKTTTMWLPLWSGAGLPAVAGAGVTDPCTGLLLNLLGTGGSWKGNGRNFSGTDYLQTAALAPTAALRHLFNLKRLTEDEAFVFWAVLDHPVSFSGQNTLFHWGRTSGSGSGWGFKLAGSTGKLSWVHRGQGASTTDTPNLSTAGFTGDGGNTRTAVAIHLTKSPVNVNGSGMPQQIEIHAAIRHLHQTGAYGLNRSSVDTPFAIPATATDTASYLADTGLTIGAAPTSSPSNLGDTMGAGNALLQIGFQRRPRTEGIQTRIVRDLSNNQFNFPQSAAII